MIYLWLIIAVIAEVIATSALAASDGLTRLGPSVVTVIGYCVAFYLLSLSLRVMPVGIVYAVWSGLGIVLIAAVGTVWLRQPLDLPAVVDLGLILAGVVVVNVFSKAVGH
jgi:small multidrug resistance pump